MQSLEYRTISQEIVSVLSFNHGFATVELANHKRAFVPADLLNGHGLNPESSPRLLAMPLVMDRISDARKGLIGRHATLRRTGQGLLVTKLCEAPVQVPNITESLVSEIVTAIQMGVRLTRDQAFVSKFLSFSHNPTLREFYKQIKRAQKGPHDRLISIGSLTNGALQR